MSKYLATIKIYLQSAVIKKADFFTVIITTVIQISSVVILWIAIYDTNSSFNGYSLQDTVIYYAMIVLVTYITDVSTVDYISKHIKNGTLSEWLLRPRSILLTEISRSIGIQLYKLAILLPIYTILWIVIEIANTNIHFTIENILLGLFFAVLGFFINILLSYTLALFAFWLDEVWSIEHFKKIITNLLGGKVVPLTFFPSFIREINSILPFQFIYFVPLEYFLGKRILVGGDFVNDMVSAIGWIVFFLLLSNIIYKIGIKQYGAFGN